MTKLRLVLRALAEPKRRVEREASVLWARGMPWRAGEAVDFFSAWIKIMLGSDCDEKKGRERERREREMEEAGRIDIFCEG